MSVVIPVAQNLAPRWRFAHLPVGPHPLPEWLKDLHVDWMERSSNPPTICLKSTRELCGWEGQVWVKTREMYRAFHDDGRMEQLSHDGPLKWDAQQAAWVSTKQEGFGGSSYRLKTSSDPSTKSFLGGAIHLSQDGWFGESEIAHGAKFMGQTHGFDIVLIGPWATGAPEGYHEVSYVDPNAGWRIKWRPPGKNWYDDTATGGLFITNDLLKRALARFQPHLRAAWTQSERGGTRIMPMGPRDTAPKGFTVEQFDEQWRPTSVP